MMQIRNHPELFSLDAGEATELLVKLGADTVDSARWLVEHARAHAFGRAPVGRYYVQVDHVDDKFIVSIHGLRSSAKTLEIR